jgi:hypothetical protein
MTIFVKLLKQDERLAARLTADEKQFKNQRRMILKFLMKNIRK